MVISSWNELKGRSFIPSSVAYDIKRFVKNFNVKLSISVFPYDERSLTYDRLNPNMCDQLIVKVLRNGETVRTMSFSVKHEVSDKLAQLNPELQKFEHER